MLGKFGCANRRRHIPVRLRRNPLAGGITARRPFTPDELLELRHFAGPWRKIVARRAFGDDGPGLDFDTTEQIAHAAAWGLAEGTLHAQGVELRQSEAVSTTATSAAGPTGVRVKRS